jgi:anti-sigma factor RsiW
MEPVQCDAIVVSAMALMDGEAAPIDRAEIDLHMLTCRRCATEIETLRSLAERLAPVSRAAVTADLWPAIEAKLDRTAAIPAGLVLTAGSVCLLAWRGLEAATMDPLALWTRPVTIGVAVLLFLGLRANPFRVDPRLHVRTLHADS